MKISGSKLPIVLACPSAPALPQIDTPPGPPAVAGTIRHRYLELVGQGVAPVEAAAEAPAEFRPFLLAIDPDAIRRGVVTEAAFALDWRARSARYLGANLGRRYDLVDPPLGPTEIPLTIDVLGVDVGARRGLAEDWKTGRTRYGSPERYAQTAAAAAAAALVWDLDLVDVGLLYVDNASGEVWPSRGSLDTWAIEAFLDDLEGAMDAVGEARRIVAAGGTPNVTPGDHCDHCPAFKACPAKTALIRQLPAVEAWQRDPGERQRWIVERFGVGYMTPERLGETWAQLEILDDVLSALRGEIRGYVMSGTEIPLPNGWKISAVESTREELDGRVARDVLAQLVSPEDAEQAVTIEVTKTAIEDAARRLNEREIRAGRKRLALTNKAGDGIVDRILGEIRRRGGSKVKVERRPQVNRRKA